MLYMVIAFDTPLTPLVQRLLRNPAGVFTLVMCVILVLILGMIGLTSSVQWLHKREAEKKRAV